MKYYPTEREQRIVFSLLPENKRDLIALLRASTTKSEKEIRSLLWNMKRVGLIYTYSGQIKKSSELLAKPDSFGEKFTRHEQEGK